MADLRKCIGSTRFGIEAHEAPVEEFPVQPSQKDGRGRMCKPHWKAYTTALRKAAKAKQDEAAPPEPTEAKPSRRKAKAEKAPAELVETAKA